MPTLDWIGKNKVINHHQDVPYRVLVRQYSFDENDKHDEDNGSENMIIQGDNLKALKSLLPRYEGKVKCIYVDPPYNTGNEKWKYNDNVNDPRIKKWLEKVVGKEGEDLSRHDKWLCMMYPRLRLLQKLLSHDGVIFISIDDTEMAPLRILCNDIFGMQNFVAQFVWRSDGNFDNQAKVKICHEYVLCYMKNPNLVGLPKGVDPAVPHNSKIYNDFVRNTIVKNGSKNPITEIELPAGFPSSTQRATIDVRNDAYPHYLKPARIEQGCLVAPTRVASGWSSKDLLQQFIDNQFRPVVDNRGQETTFEITATGAIEIVKKRTFRSHVLSVLSRLGSTQSMSSELSQMQIKFDYPKPVELLEYLIDFYTEDGDIVLDPFAGSGSTGHAVLKLNKRDGKNRHFILVELDEYAENITAERIKKAIKGYRVSKKRKEIIYSKTLTMNNLNNAGVFVREALSKSKEAQSQYSKVCKPRLENNQLIVEAEIEKNEEKPGTGGNFSFYKLGALLLNEDGQLNTKVDTEKIRSYIWFMETREELPEQANKNPYFLGKHSGCAYYFYYEKDAITTLNYEFLSTIPERAETYVVYADRCALSEAEMQRFSLTYKKIPRDIVKL